MRRTGFEAELDQFRESARRFFQGRIGPHSERWREQRIVDREAYLAAGAMGYLCMWVGEQYGGLGLTDLRYEQILIEENVWHGDRGFFAWLHSRLVAPYIEQFGTEEQKRRLYPDLISGRRILAIAMTEPDAGSDLAAMKSRAVEKDDHWVLNGSKTYISNGINADVVVVAARTDPDKPHGLTLFLLERGMEGFERGANLKKMGLKSQDTAELFFRDVRIPKANVLGQPNAGFKHLMQGLPVERLLAAIFNIASAQLAMRVTVDYVRERRAFGQPLKSYQNTRFKLAELDTQIAIGQSWVDRLVIETNAGRLDGADAARAKLFTSEVNGRMVDEGVQLHGGAGYMEEYPICRLYQDERVHRILAGTSEIMKEIIARDILDARSP
jgi:alkylation response protein AidB-like acyl-CoA dehydrogenase